MLAAHYQEIGVAPALAGAVECLWTVTTGGPEPAWLVLPDGCLDIVYWAEGGLRAVGTMTVAQRASLPGSGAVMGLRFRPGHAARALGVAATELTDGWAPLDALWGRRGRALAERLANSRPAECVALLQASLRPAEAPEGVQRAIAALAASGGTADLDTLARHTNLSPRQFRRRVLEETGLSPKRLARVLRFQRAMAAGRGGGSWAEVAAGCGYFDQAHLIRDFREFSGRTPGELLPVSDFSNRAGSAFA
jgi:AraC-like DNA-binding protein